MHIWRILFCFSAAMIAFIFYILFHDGADDALPTKIKVGQRIGRRKLQLLHLKNPTAPKHVPFPPIANWTALKQKKILLWFVPFENDYAMVEESIFTDPFPTSVNNLSIESSQCGRCKIIFNRELLNKSSAVVFHSFYPDDRLDLPRKRKKQVFVWWSQESAYTARYYPDMRHYFDWTMTVSRKSDVFSPYASFPWILKFISPWRKKFDFMRNMFMMKEDAYYEEEDVHGREESISRRKRNAISTYDWAERELRDLLKKKDRTVAWIYSNCDTAGAVMREEIADAMEIAGFEIDRFGRCGMREFPIQSRWDPEFFREISTYKFYMSFENSFHCRGYATEKLWFNALYSGSVPIIWGPHRKDIEEALPPKSYIHVEGFKSIKSLVAYLQYLDSNSSAYAQYLEWRTWTKYVDKNGEYHSDKLHMKLDKPPSRKTRALLDKYATPEPIGFCRLCRKLHLENRQKSKKLPNEGIDIDERSECWHSWDAEDMKNKLFEP